MKILISKRGHSLVLKEGSNNNQMDHQLHQLQQEFLPTKWITKRENLEKPPKLYMQGMETKK